MENVLRDLSYGVYIVSAKDERRVGCVVNTVAQITSDPKTVIVSINHDNYTNAVIKSTKRFAVSILASDSDPSIIGTFGYKSSASIDKFENFENKELKGIPVITDSIGAFTCDVIDMMETDTHTVFLGKVNFMEKFRNSNSMTYKYYHEVLKGKSPKNAPTFEEDKNEQNENKTIWKCSVCGFEVEMNELPDDYVCPICGVGKDRFVQKE